MTSLPADYRGARAEREQQHRPRRPKLMTSAEAIDAHVRDGDHLAIGGVLFARTPMALLLEVLRSGKRDLVLSRPLMGYEAELLLATGQTTRIVTSWTGVGRSLAPVLRHHVENGLAQMEEWSHLAIGMRYKAAAMGLPFLPLLSMVGSGLAELTDVRQVTCPYTGDSIPVVPSLVPDVALVHVQRADVLGNAQIDGYSAMDEDVVRAARRVVISAERIVPTDELRAGADRTAISHFMVDAVVEQHHGAFPHEVYGAYHADYELLDEITGLLRDGGPAGARAYVERLLSLPTFDDLLAQYGQERIAHADELAKEA